MQQISSQQKKPVILSQNSWFSWIGRLFLIGIGLVVVYILGSNLVKSPVLFTQNVIDGLKLGFVYALIALGYTMVYGIVKLINFAHGDIFMVGAFVSFFAINNLNLHTWPLKLFPGMDAGLSVGIGTVTTILLAMAICALLAITIEHVAYKPLREAPRISVLITAIGVSFFLEYFGLLDFVYTAKFISYTRPFEVVTWYIKDGFHQVQSGVTPPDGSIMISNILIIIVIVTILMQVFLQYLVRRTKIGIAMRATSYDKAAARLMGINVDSVITFTFAIGAAFAGVGGVLYAIAYPLVTTLMGVYPGLKAFVAAVMGGIGSIPGALVGALIMGQAEALTASYISTPMRDAIAFSILILVLLIRPTGIFGEPEKEKA